MPHKVHQHIICLQKTSIYGDQISVKELVASYVHLCTLYWWLRPFGCGVFLGGYGRDGPQLYMIEPSGVSYVSFSEMDLSSNDLTGRIPVPLFSVPVFKNTSTLLVTAFQEHISLVVVVFRNLVFQVPLSQVLPENQNLRL
ncbi:uncharacterized protein LOC141707490 isoform X3 [Apium graveolens]|uniref:uncharacterized protein LOC141707490 isoform X3 n=1 Tax=Apium graveolens TaxID=4045 RepID=UPI003D7A5BBE